MLPETDPPQTSSAKREGKWLTCFLGIGLLTSGIRGIALGEFGSPIGGSYIRIHGWSAYAASLASCLFGIWWLTASVGRPFKFPGAPRLLWVAVTGSSIVFYLLFTTQSYPLALGIAYITTIVLWLLSAWISRSFKGGRPISAGSGRSSVSRGRSGDNEERLR